MLDFLTSPVWQFVGATVGFVSLLVSIFIYLRQRITKRLSYEIVSDISLQSILGGDSSPLQLAGKNLPSETHLVVLRISNIGNVAIHNADFMRPISIDFDQNAELLSAEVKESNVDFELKLSNTNEIFIMPFLLNPGDSFSIQLLIANFKGSVHFYSRIAGLKEIERRVSVLTRVMARRVQVLHGIRWVRSVCTTGLTIILGGWITTAYLSRQAVDYTFLIISSGVLGVILTISLIAERVFASKARSFNKQE